ncbi:acetyl-CoA carboxylase biotin carboxyl carrier protein [Plastoroseomonas hellenica]|uniref:Biotin carboxyl carrier protein of acetyl-CoA carboxylase n=1 Tax=Plastoroseomonas hellenica TaxID=2687306 RepID=A0ABS5EW85_9PROT|nr:acetyl-CoA carboxylase biotin carboxyl carrier protein [Plastoroseomonas hellenica]MBR0645781.1 acetyl-CoA carboxylase biotin carboxyl carrier protein [Plastoroseomonas hellenica]MBR0664566.1 acetyl-CoA carboxylase biotin carboxyl carrier protein [Plastoroseomonas hellenica]
MAGGIQFDPKAIRELANILRETDLSEIELVEKDSRLRVARVVTAPPQVMVQAAAPVAAAATPVASAVAAPVAEAEAAAHPGAITSPMVGVAYLAPEPGAAPFIQTGTKVAQGQTLLLIEAMKTFNQIKAPRAGTVTRILIETGTPVEFGEALLIIE